MIETHTCIVVLCDACGDEWYQDRGVIHFPDFAAAVAILVDPGPVDDESRWTITRDDGVLCPDHRMQAECEAMGGHDWSEWYPDPSNDLVKGHTCERCCMFETNIPAMVEQMVAEVNPS